MSEDRAAVRAVAWHELFPALSLFSALRLALKFRTLLLAAIAIVGVSAGWRICGRVFHDPETSPSNPFEYRIEANRAWPWEDPVVVTWMGHLTSIDAWWRQSPLPLAWNHISSPFQRIFAADADFVEVVYWVCCALWSLVVWAFFGGAITRIAAVAIARQETVPLGALNRFVRQRFSSYVVAPLFPMIGIFLAGALLAVPGLIMRSDMGLLLAGIVWPLVLVVGFLMAFLLLGLFFSWPLMWGAISAEGTDAFGALSHSYSYAYQRPLHFLGYVIASAVIGVFGWYLVSVFADWIIALSAWGVGWGSGAARVDQVLGSTAELGTVGSAGASIIRFWNHCLRTLSLAFVFSYFWSSSTVIYFLLRRMVDATEMDEVYMSEDHERHGLPPLKNGTRELAEIADDPTSTSDKKPG